MIEIVVYERQLRGVVDARGRAINGAGEARLGDVERSLPDVGELCSRLSAVALALRL